MHAGGNALLNYYPVEDVAGATTIWSLTRREWTLLVGGYLLLAVACYREAVAIAQIAG